MSKIVLNPKDDLGIDSPLQNNIGNGGAANLLDAQTSSTNSLDNTTEIKIDQKSQPEYSSVSYNVPQNSWSEDHTNLYLEKNDNLDEKNDLVFSYIQVFAIILFVISLVIFIYFVLKYFNLF